MSTPAIDVKAILDALGTLGIINIGHLNATPDVLGVIYEYGGQAPDGRFGVTGVGYEKPSLQVVFRGIANDYTGPMTKARIAWDALAGVQPGSIFLSITPQQSPFSLGKDSNHRFEIACNFYAMKVPN